MTSLTLLAQAKSTENSQRSEFQAETTTSILEVYSVDVNDRCWIVN